MYYLPIVEDVFRTREFSKIQKYLACVRKKPVIPSIVKRQGISATDKKQSADFFNEFFCSVFHKDTPNIVKPYYPKREVNTVHISEERVTELLGTLQVGKATGPDRIGNQKDEASRCCEFTDGEDVQCFFR